jgi:uncharacterized protein (TIGR02147 family)
MASHMKDSTVVRPDIYGYHDYRSFLKDWFAFLKSTRPGFSVRAIARESGISESYLSMVLSGERSLSSSKLDKLTGPLGIDNSQQSYLSWLRTIVEADDETERLDALKKIQRFRQYRALNSMEIETYEYLTNWHYVAIREMSALPDFAMDPKWIRARLKHKIPVKSIRDALEFLVRHGFIELDESGKCKRPSKGVHGKTGVLKPALIKFHREMLTQACDSIESTPSEHRNISAHTAAIPLEKVEEARRILDDARAKIMALVDDGDSKQSEVYHFGFLAFPLTKSSKGEGS